MKNFIRETDDQKKSFEVSFVVFTSFLKKWKAQRGIKKQLIQLQDEDPSQFDAVESAIQNTEQILEKFLKAARDYKTAALKAKEIFDKNNKLNNLKSFFGLQDKNIEKEKSFVLKSDGQQSFFALAANNEAPEYSIKDILNIDFDISKFIPGNKPEDVKQDILNMLKYRSLLDKTSKKSSSMQDFDINEFYDEIVKIDYNKTPFDFLNESQEEINKIKKEIIKLAKEEFIKTIELIKKYSKDRIKRSIIEKITKSYAKKPVIVLAYDFGNEDAISSDPLLRNYGEQKLIIDNEEIFKFLKKISDENQITIEEKSLMPAIEKRSFSQIMDVFYPTKSDDEKEPAKEFPSLAQIKRLLTDTREDLNVIKKEPSVFTIATKGEGIDQYDVIKVRDVYKIGNDFFEQLDKNLDEDEELMTILSNLLQNRPATKSFSKFNLEKIKKAYDIFPKISIEKLQEMKKDLQRLYNYTIENEQEVMDTFNISPEKYEQTWQNIRNGIETGSSEDRHEVYNAYYQFFKQRKPELLKFFTTGIETESDPEQTEEPEAKERPEELTQVFKNVELGADEEEALIELYRIMKEQGLVSENKNEAIRKFLESLPDDIRNENNQALLRGLKKLQAAGKLDQFAKIIKKPKVKQDSPLWSEEQGVELKKRIKDFVKSEEDIKSLKSDIGEFGSKAGSVQKFVDTYWEELIRDFFPSTNDYNQDMNASMKKEKMLYKEFTKMIQDEIEKQSKITVGPDTDDLTEEEIETIKNDIRAFLADQPTGRQEEFVDENKLETKFRTFIEEYDSTAEILDKRSEEKKKEIEDKIKELLKIEMKKQPDTSKEDKIVLDQYQEEAVEKAVEKVVDGKSEEAKEIIKKVPIFDEDKQKEVEKIPEAVEGLKKYFEFLYKYIKSKEQTNENIMSRIRRTRSKKSSTAEFFNQLAKYLSQGDERQIGEKIIEKYKEANPNKETTPKLPEILKELWDSDKWESSDKEAVMDAYKISLTGGKNLSGTIIRTVFDHYFKGIVNKKRSRDNLLKQRIEGDFWRQALMGVSGNNMPNKFINLIYNELEDFKKNPSYKEFTNDELKKLQDEIDDIIRVAKNTPSDERKPKDANTELNPEVRLTRPDELEEIKINKLVKVLKPYLLEKFIRRKQYEKTN